jgi:hypothetical protein
MQYLFSFLVQIFQDYAFKENSKDINENVEIDFETVRYVLLETHWGPFAFPLFNFPSGKMVGESVPCCKLFEHLVPSFACFLLFHFSQTYVSIIAGCCLAMAMKFAGSFNQEAFKTLVCNFFLNHVCCFSICILIVLYFFFISDALYKILQRNS